MAIYGFPEPRAVYAEASADYVDDAKGTQDDKRPGSAHSERYTKAGRVSTATLSKGSDHRGLLLHGSGHRRQHMDTHARTRAISLVFDDFHLDENVMH